MSIELDDLVGLNATTVARIVGLSPQGADAALMRLLKEEGALTPAGMRHSQGGHTAIKGGAVLLTESMGIGGKRFWDRDDKNGLITVAAGVTWTELHAHLRGSRWAPMVQQSSAHFTIGGSVAVNCHGRDPRWGPMVQSVESLSVLCGDGKPRDASRIKNPDLFAAVVGGYGACGMILKVRLQLVPNHMLGPNNGDRRELKLDEYFKDHLKPLLDLKPGEGKTELHYGWLKCTEEEFWEKVWVENCVSLEGQDIDDSGALENPTWGESEILRAAWVAARKQPSIKSSVWQEMMRRSSNEQKSRTNSLRASVDMTLSKGDSKGVDILQEYFFPPKQLEKGLSQLKAHFRAERHQRQVNVLSATLRLVRRDTETNLSYCPDGDRVSLAVEVHVPVDLDKRGRRCPTLAAQAVLWQANEIVLALGGSYYLPYYRLSPAQGSNFSSQFTTAYGGRLAAQKDAIKKFDPYRRFWNAFLQTHFG